MRVRHGCLLVVCVLLSGCGATTLFAGGNAPDARPVDTALRLARYLDNQMLAADSASSAQTECYPLPGNVPVSWQCLVRGALSPQQDPLDHGLELEIGYRPSTGRFTELGRSAPAPQLQFGSAPVRAVLGARPVQTINQIWVERVSCAETSQAAWCAVSGRPIHPSHRILIPNRFAGSAATRALQAAIAMMRAREDCGEPPYCAPAGSAFTK